jgi:molybdopterin-containing oxidoreductase family molybdopterin binding subunit
VLEDPWCFHITQKVVEPMYERRHAAETFIEILYRMGLRPKVNGFISGYLGLSPEEALRPDEEIVWEDLCDRVVRHNFGPEHNWEWFKKNGFISWPKKVEEVYWKYERPGRVPLYWEFFIHSAEKARSIVEKMGIELKWGHFTPVADWFPIHPLTADDGVHDLFCFNVGDSLCATSTSTEQPWVDEVSQMNPYSYNFTMNVDTAAAKGLKDGDRIEAESDKGNKLTGLLKTRKAQHPLTLSVMGRTGHWAFGQPIAKGKGIPFQYMMDTKFSECDPLTWHPEPCVKVKITKIK